jgi:hypothetical protein
MDDARIDEATTTFFKAYNTDIIILSTTILYIIKTSEIKFMLSQA